MKIYQLIQPYVFGLNDAVNTITLESGFGENKIALKARRKRTLTLLGVRTVCGSIVPFGHSR
jgi:hypothetical protein